MRIKLLCAALAAWLFAFSSAWAAPAASLDIFVPNDELIKLGANLSEFAPGAVSHDETMMLAHQKVLDPKEIAKGHNYKLFIIKIDRSAKKITATTTFLPVASLEQYAWTADNKTVLCTGDWGTHILAVDVATGAVRTIFKHEKGHPGFRIKPSVTWFEKGKVHMPGFFYDAEQTMTGQWVVAIDPTKSGLDALEKVLDVGPLMARTLGWSASIWYSTDQAYFVSGTEDKGVRTIGLYAFLGDQKNLRLLETCKYRFDLAAVGLNRVIGVMRDIKDEGRAVITDVMTNKQWRIGEPKKVYLYPYMSRDGNTVLVSSIDLSGRKMTTWYAHEGDAFGLHPMPGMANIFPGVIRFSRQGGILAFYNKDGLYIKQVP